MKKVSIITVLVLLCLIFFNKPLLAQLQGFNLQNEPVDISPDFIDFQNTYYVAAELIDFDPLSASGKIKYERYEFATRMAFNNMMGGLVSVKPNEFPGNEYAPVGGSKVSFCPERYSPGAENGNRILYCARSC